MKRMIILFILLPTLVLSQGEERGNITREEPITKEKLLKVFIKYGNGYIDLRKNTDSQLFKSEFYYTQYRPDIEYDVVGEEGNLDIHFSGDSGGDRESRHIKSLDELYDNEMNLSFTDKLPLDFDLDFGIIKGDMDFTGLRVKNVGLEVGVSKTVIIFDQPNRISLEEFTLEGGVGKLRIEKLGNANVKDFSFEGGIGSYEIDFSGKYQQDLAGKIQLGMGTLNLYLPRDVGVRMEVEKSFLSSFTVDEVYKNGDVYTNDRWEKSPYKIELEIETGVGGIDVVWVD